MTEAATIHSHLPQPNTVQSLAADLRALGITPGMTLLVHSSLRSLGWVAGGPVAVVLALEEVLGPNGTLVMPAFTTGLSDPASWRNPPVPEVWWETIRQTTPPFDKAMTPTRQMGSIVECFRTQPGVQRSDHPLLSFVAWGKHARFVTEEHSLEDPLGNQSPLARVYDLGGSVLLLGVSHGNNTSLHLSEHRVDFPGKRRVQDGAPMLIHGTRQWVTFGMVDFNDADFAQIGADFARDKGLERQAQVGLATARLMPQRDLVDYGITWLPINRKAESDG